MALMAVIRGLGQLFYILLGFRYGMGLRFRVLGGQGLGFRFQG